MKHTHLIILFFLFVFNLNANSQVKTKTFPKEISEKEFPLYSIKGKKYKIPTPSEFFSLKERNNINLNRFAVRKDIEFDFLKNATLVKISDKSIYSLTLESDEAINLSLKFNEFNLPKNSILSIYSINELTDSITTAENNLSQTWQTRTYDGNAINITLQTSSEEVKFVKLKVASVYLGYRSYENITNFGSPGSSASCNVNVICPVGSSWANERNSVAIIKADDSHFSGTLIMNTCGTNRPFLLTANHARAAKPNVEDYVFQFLFYSTDCSSNIGYREDLQFYGSTLKAASALSDFTLLELNQTPASNSGLTYAGWTTQTNLIFSTTMLHHPAADVMKISQDYQSPQMVTLQPSGMQCWRTELDLGGFQGGSSGGPIFNQSHRLIGQLFGKQTVNVGNPCHPEAFSGRFNISWTGDGTNATRLSNWLDPLNTNQTTTNTTNVANLIPHKQSALAISGNENFCGATSTYSLNVPTGVSVSWQSSNPNIASITPSGNPATLTRNFDGVVTITATIASCGNNLSATKEIVIGAPQIEMINFSNDVGGQGYWCSTHYNNLFSVEPANLNNATFEARLLNYPSMTVFRTNSNANTGTDPFGYVPSGWYIIQLRTTNACGTSTWYETEIEYVDCLNYRGGVENFRVVASPNPTNGDLTVSIDNEKAEVKLLSKTEKVIYQLYNFNRTSIVRQWIFDNSVNRQKLNVRGLSSGQYILVVTKGKYRQSTQIIIK